MSCIHFDDNVKTAEFNQQENLIYDNAYIKYENKVSQGPGNYKTQDLRSCECGIPNVIRKATDLPSYASKQFKDGFGWNSCDIGVDSDLRFSQLTNKRCLNNLNTIWCCLKRQSKIFDVKKISNSIEGSGITIITISIKMSNIT